MAHRKTTLAAGGLALLLSAAPMAPAAAQYGPIDRPDAQIRRGQSAPFAGDDIYNNRGFNQRADNTDLRRNNAVARFDLRIQNDGAVGDDIRVEGPGSTRHFRVRYFFGGVDVTSEVVSGRFRVRNLAPGDSRVLSVQVTTRNAPPRRARDLFITTSSRNAPTQSDTVRARVQVR